QNQLWLPSVMEALVARGVTRLLVEGGPTVWRAFADAALVDEVALFMAARPDRPQTETEAHGAITRWLGSLPLSLDDVMDVAMDRLWRFRRRSTTEGA
ncbi:MAG: dihydrofolate reductase family protein, partial [Hyphomicrobium sp.]|nr:dihydrofolate reductase family protein [Hyphomicrobium sp.]